MIEKKRSASSRKTGIVPFCMYRFKTWCSPDPLFKLGDVPDLMEPEEVRSFAAGGPRFVCGLAGVAFCPFFAILFM